LRWQSRRKCLLSLPEGTRFDPTLNDHGLLSQIQLDLGQVISATPRPLYPDNEWEQTYNNKIPEISEQEILIEYTAHPEAAFHLFDGKAIPVSELGKPSNRGQLLPVAPALQLVKIRVVEKGSTSPVPVKLHVHGEHDEYLAPVDRHRAPWSPFV
jgi:hypothetical protein